MRRAVRILAGVLAAIAAASAAAAQPSSATAPLTIVSAGPTGEVASLAEANEIRIVFSEPMVTVGRIPPIVRAPFVRMTPEIPGRFRWSGTTILIFTPDADRPLPYATRFEVAVETTAVAVSGRRLAQPYTFSFTTPTATLLQTSWYRRGGRADAPIVVVMRFNQPVRPADVLAHLQAAFQPRDFTPPVLTREMEARLTAIDPTAADRFRNKVEAARTAARASDPVRFRLTIDWDRERYPPGDNLVALESVTPVPSQSRVRLQIGPRMPSPAGDQVPGRTQGYDVEVEPAFFVRGFWCRTACDPDRRNPLELTSEVRTDDFAAAVRVTDITDAAAARAVEKPAAPPPSRRGYDLDQDDLLSIEDAGFASQPPATTYAVAVDQNLRSADGQTLGYAWVETVENWHQRAFTSFGDGHGVWETGGGSVLPFYSRNFTAVTQWAAPIALRELMPTIVSLHPRFDAAPPGPGRERRLGGRADRIESHGLELTDALGGRSTGLVWAAVREDEPIARARPLRSSATRASVVQVTNLGITVKDSPQNTLVFVSRLDTGAPVAGATVSIVRLDNEIVWTGTTGADGVAIAPETRLREPDAWYRFAFLVTAEKDGDIAYAGSDWHEGILPWDFGLPLNLHEADPLLRGTVFSDRGVYRLGEEVHLKAILRHNTSEGVRLLPAGTRVFVSLRDSQDRAVDERTVTVNAWSSAEWTVALPGEGSLGTYTLRAMLERDRPAPRGPEALRPGETPGPRADRYVPYWKTVTGSFLVAAYRRPDFRVDVALTAAGEPVAGADLTGRVTARYLFGATMGARPLVWSYSKEPLTSAPAAVREAFPDDRWVFVGPRDRQPIERGQIRRDTAELTAEGDRELTLPTTLDAGVPYAYTLEGDVEDVSRQHIANRATFTVHPAPWYVGVRRPQYFTDQKAGLDTEIVTVTPAGLAAGGVPVTVTLTQVQWISVRRAEGNGFYTWDTERREVPAGSWTVTTGRDPAPLHIPIPAGGYYVLEATAREEGGRFAVTRTSFYALGDGYTAWARFDHNRIELVPERQTYKPGETARVMIQSPWEHATALVTTEREGIRSHRQFALTSTQESIEIPITEADIPNVYVSVLLVKGRTQAAAPADAAVTGGPSAVADPSDPGKPAFRLGYVELKVEDASKRLTVAVKANREEYRPANTATVTLSVKDHRGRGTRSEVTLWAVDYGVLSLTAYQTPDVLRSVYVEKALQVITADSRERIISRRVLTPKGETDGGGGGSAAGAGDVRKDFRVLAFWIGSVVTDAGGNASLDVKLPESLTTYRIMAVAGDRLSRFGSADTEVRVNKPLTLKPAFPRFLAVGDRAHFGAVITSQLPEAGRAAVTITSLDPDVLTFTGRVEQTIEVGAGGAVEARFDAAGLKIGRARVRMTVKMANETDAFEDVIPVDVLASPETVAAYGETTGEASEAVSIPEGVVPGLGGLHVELSSTALVGLGEGARYLVEYPYGCAEQRASRTVAMILASDLGDAFALPGIETGQVRPAAQQALKELERYQCPGGGFAYWPGACHSVTAYLTAYVLDVFRNAVDLKYEVDPDVRARGYDYLARALAAPPPVNEGWWPAYTAWQAFAVKVLVEGGRNQDSNLNRLYGYRDRMPVFALAYLHDALLARRGPASPATAERVTELRRRMMNAVLPEAGSAHVEELSDPYLLWFWNSNVRSTAIVLRSFVKAGAANAPIRELVRWLMEIRKDGRWGNTQENAYAMEALVAYYRRYEPTAPDFTAVVSLGAGELARETFTGRSTAAETTTVPMADLLSTVKPGSTRPLTFGKTGSGTLFYTARLRYAADQLYQDTLDNGIRIERRYEPFVDDGQAPPATSFKAGDLVRVVLTFTLTKERRYVAVTDPLPAGFEAVESWFATTAASLRADRGNDGGEQDGWFSWWQRGGFDHVERHDDRVRLFATRLGEGTHTFTYLARATTAGAFRTAPARAEEMYEPEVFGRTATATIEVR